MTLQQNTKPNQFSKEVINDPGFITASREKLLQQFAGKYLTNTIFYENFLE